MPGVTKTSLKLNRLFFLMPKQPFHIVLNNSFPKSNKEEWLRIASQELNEKNPFEKLSWQAGDLRFYPYYDDTDISDLHYLQNFNVPPVNSTGNMWQNLPIIKVLEEKKANAVALEYLAYGADGILFDLTELYDLDVDVLLTEITWPYCNISFLSDGRKDFVIKIVTHIQKNNYQPASLRGSIFWNTLPDKYESCLREMDGLQNFYPLGIIIKHSNPVEEISEALLSGVKQVEYLTTLGIEKENAFRKISVSLPCEENFLLNIAKMKTLRLLWYQIAHAFDIKNFNPHDLHLHSRSEKWTEESFQPQSNMLNSTYHALASVLGGCNSLTLMVEDQHNTTMNRAALHVSNILREESHLDQVSNGIAGSYAIDAMVHDLAFAAWKNFQQAVST
jgi:methylmalonyl-CoA mutase